MAKINRIRINQAIQNLKHIAYLSELPTPSEDSADFVSINNVLYAKQVNNGVYSYAELGAGGTTVIEKTLNEEGTEFIDTFTEEDIDKLIGGGILKVKVNEVVSYYLTPMITQNTDEGVKGVGLGGFLDTQEGTMLMVNVMTMNGQVRTQVYTTEGFGGSGVAFIDITGLDILPSEYRSEETLKTAILFDTDHLLRLTWIDDMYYFGNTDDFQYRYLSIDTSDWVIMRYDLQEIAKAPKAVNLNTYVPSTATNGTLDSSVLATLQANDSNYIVFNNEIFKLADKQHNEGYLVYSHNGHDTTGCFFQKCITITISTRGWVLEEQENQPKLESGTNIKTINNQSILGSGNITIEGGGGSGGGKTTVNATPTEEQPSNLGQCFLCQVDAEIIDLVNTNIYLNFDGIEMTFTYNVDYNVYVSNVEIEPDSGVYLVGIYIAPQKFAAWSFGMGLGLAPALSIQMEADTLNLTLNDIDVLILKELITRKKIVLSKFSTSTAWFFTFNKYNIMMALSTMKQLYYCFLGGGSALTEYSLLLNTADNTLSIQIVS